MSRKRTVVDNVIYANFGRGPQVIKQPAKTSRKRTDHRSFAARILPEYVQDRADKGRISRGRSYARNGHVVQLQFAAGRVEAQVAGSQNRPFNVAILLPYRQPDQINEVLESIAATPHGLKLAQTGGLPDELIRELLAHGPDELRLRCDCPDPALVCKHMVAVAEAAAEQIEGRPERVFVLRGIQLDQLHQLISAVASGAAEDTAQTPELFWQGKALPDLPDPEVIPMIEDSDLDALHKAIRCVSYTTVDELRGVADIEDLYEFLTRE